MNTKLDHDERVAAYTRVPAFAAALTGGFCLGAAGLRHLGKRGLNVKETVATWTDLLVCAAMVAYAAAIIRLD